MQIKTRHMFWPIKLMKIKQHIKLIPTASGDVHWLFLESNSREDNVNLELDSLAL